MPTQRPLAIATRKLPEPVETRMMELFACRLNLDDEPFAKPELLAAVRAADVLMPAVTDRIDAEVLAEAGPALKPIAVSRNPLADPPAPLQAGRGPASFQTWRMPA